MRGLGVRMGIIDTPLARLDSTHRTNIVDNFFPNASHQVIIFSTDTEIDQQYFDRLTPYITRVYHLEWNNAASSSNATEGYFWKPMEVTQD
jgi:DNA sulfur modification protein DndD